MNVLRGCTTSFTVKYGTQNFHDMVQALADGDTDFVLQFAHPDIPAIFNEINFESILLAEIEFFPVSTTDLNGVPLYSLPGTKENPLPHFTYSQDGYLALVEDLLQEKNANNPIYLHQQDTSPTAEVLKSLILTTGGIAWLPVNCIYEELENGKLALAADQAWITTLEIRLFRSQKHQRPLVSRIWEIAQAASLK